MMSKTVAAFYGLLAGGITAGTLANALWFSAIIAILCAMPAVVSRLRARKGGEDR